jgi:hypothetical protein
VYSDTCKVWIRSVLRFLKLRTWREKPVGAFFLNSENEGVESGPFSLKQALDSQEFPPRESPRTTFEILQTWVPRIARPSRFACETHGIPLTSASTCCVPMLLTTKTICGRAQSCRRERQYLLTVAEQPSTHCGLRPPPELRSRAWQQWCISELLWAVCRACGAPLPEHAMDTRRPQGVLPTVLARRTPRGSQKPAHRAPHKWAGSWSFQTWHVLCAGRAERRRRCTPWTRGAPKG